MTALATIVVAILILDVGFILGCWWASDARRWDEVDQWVRCRACDLAVLQTLATVEPRGDGHLCYACANGPWFSVFADGTAIEITNPIDPESFIRGDDR